MPALARLGLGRPDRRTCGSVNVTLGTARGVGLVGRRRARRSRRRRARPWYLPMCVSWARPARRPPRRATPPSTPAHPQPVVDLDGPPGLEPDRLEPDVGGVGAPADRDEQLVAHERRRRRSSDERARRRRRATRPSRSTPVRTVMPSASNAAATSSPANGSSRASRRSPPSTTVTCSEPSRRNACAISTPIGPPPSTRKPARHLARRRRVAVVPGRDVGEALDRRHERRRAGREHDRPRRGECAHARSGLDLDRALARRGARRPRTSSMPLALEPRGLRRRRSTSWSCSRAGRRPRPRRATPVTASAAPGTRRAAASTSPGRISVLLGMQPQNEHSPPTSSRFHDRDAEARRRRIGRPRSHRAVPPRSR